MLRDCLIQHLTNASLRKRQVCLCLFACVYVCCVCVDARMNRQVASQ